jgi:predicted Rossmann fold nucleotide-binding protein DprA/Smf involved in DNA uptake
MTPQYLGNKALLNKKLTAFFASRTVQTARVMACYDWATSLSAETDCVVSGFQSAIERDVLHFLLKKKIPIVVVLARAIYKHIPEELKEAYDKGNLLFISVSNASRTSQVAAKARNQYAADISSTIVFGMLTEESSLYEIYLRQSEDPNKEVKLIKP